MIFYLGDIPQNFKDFIFILIFIHIKFFIQGLIFLLGILLLNSFTQQEIIC